MGSSASHLVGHNVRLQHALAERRGGKEQLACSGAEAPPCRLPILARAFGWLSCGGWAGGRVRERGGMRALARLGLGGWLVQALLAGVLFGS